MRKRVLLFPFLTTALLAISASVAQAGTGSFVLTLEDLTRRTSTIITDQVAPVPGVAGDSNTALDRILFIGKVGTFDVTIFANTYLPGPSGAPVQMNVSNFRVASTSAGQFRVTLWRTDVYSPALGSSVVGVGTAGATLTARGNVTFKSWVDGGSVFNPSSNAMTGGTLSRTSRPVSRSGNVDLLTVIDIDFDRGGTMNANTDLQVRNAAAPADHKITVGDGTAASCTEAALLKGLEAARILGGGVIRFKCGPDPVTIALTPPASESEAVTVPNNTTIDGGMLVTISGGYRPIRIDPDASARLKNLAVEIYRVENLGVLTIERSVFSNGSQAEVLNYGTLIVKNSTFHNQGGERWPISNYGTATVNRSAFRQLFGSIANAGTLAVTNTIFSDNFADVTGGIYNEGTLTIDKGEFTNNGGNDGAAILNGGSFAIKNTSFNRNWINIGPGGAITNFGGSLSTVDNTEFFDNSGFFGGAISNLGPISIRNSTFTGNRAEYGGGIYTEGALRITDSRITANTADLDGGGIYANGANPKLIRTAVTGNTPNNVVIVP